MNYIGLILIGGFLWWKFFKFWFKDFEEESPNEREATVGIFCVLHLVGLIIVIFFYVFAILQSELTNEQQDEYFSILEKYNIRSAERIFTNDTKDGRITYSELQDLRIKIEEDSKRWKLERKFNDFNSD